VSLYAVPLSQYDPAKDKVSEWDEPDRRSLRANYFVATLTDVCVKVKGLSPGDPVTPIGAALV